MFRKESRVPVHVVSSSSDSDEKESNKKPKTSGASSSKVNSLYKFVSKPEIAIIDLSDDDDDLFLPLQERLLKAKGDRKVSSFESGCYSSSSSSVTSYVKAPTVEKAFIKTFQSNILSQNIEKEYGADEFNLPSTSSIKSLDNFDTDSLPDLDDPPSCPSSPESQNARSGTFSVDVRNDCGDIIADKQTNSKAPRRTKRSKEDIFAEQEVKRRAREDKLKLREERLTAKEKEKKMKEIRKQELNSIKPNECIKNVLVLMDLHLLELPEAVNIPKELQEASMQYNMVELFVPNCITWKRKIIHKKLDDDLQISQEYEEEDENQIALILPVNQFLTAVNNFKMKILGQLNLIGVLQQVRELYPMKRITLITSGVEKYFSAKKNKEQRQYRQHVLNEDQPTESKRKRKHNDLGFTISRIDLEEALVDLQIRESCSAYMLADSDELARLVVSITKAIAESPFKSGKVDNELSWFGIADAKDSVKVDKDGNGLKLLWQRQLQQLHMVSADTAQAIISQYPTPASIINVQICAYESCVNVQQCQQLLQDIMVRRGIGPLSSTRRIGPELSRKLHVLLTSRNGAELLDAFEY